MKDYTVRYQQNLMDIALQELGSIEGLLTLAIDNNLSITADLEIGQIIKVDTTKILDKKVVEYYQNNKIIVATAQVNQVIPPVLPTLDETGLIFDFDFEQISKMTFDRGQGMRSFADRGIVLEQNSPFPLAPKLTTEGLYFDGIDDFMNILAVGLKEIFIVCNNTSLIDNESALFVGDFEFAKYAYDSTFPNGSMLDLALSNEIRVNNMSNISFLPKEVFKSVSLIRSSPIYNSEFELCASGGIYFWQGNIKRILLFDTPRTEAQRTQLQAYLALKYSL